MEAASKDSATGTTQKTQLSLDSAELTAAFLGTFRGFCAPIVLFELLRKRFLGAINAGREYSLPITQRSSSQFPNWSFPMMPGDVAATDIHWDVVTTVRIGVLNVLGKWIHDHAQDFLDDSSLWQEAGTFLQARPTLLDFADDPDRATVAKLFDKTTNTFKLHTSRPNLESDPAWRRGSTPAASGTGARQTSEFNIDRSSALELVEFLEPVAAVFAEKVTKRDYTRACELFEKQAQDQLGWFPPRKAALDEDSFASTMYKLMDVVQVLERDGSTKTVHAALPSAVRDACAAQNLLRGWIAVQM